MIWVSTDLKLGSAMVPFPSVKEHSDIVHKTVEEGKFIRRLRQESG